jgi:hypothetical protein
LDGLRIAEDEGWKFCEEKLAAKEKGKVFTAGVLAFESAKPERTAKALSVVEEESKTVDGLGVRLGLASRCAGALAYPFPAAERQSD